MNSHYMKQGVMYWFASKYVDNSELSVFASNANSNYKNPYNAINSPYGVSKIDKKFINLKLARNLSYFKKSFILVNDKKIPLIDTMISANLTPEKYVAELSNRVNVMKAVANELKFTQPVFITITAPSEFHRLRQISLKDGRLVKLVDNPNFAGFSDHVREARDYLSNSWRKFCRSRMFYQIKKQYGSGVVYLKVYEPHIDGTPHLHVLAFIPPEFRSRFEKNIVSFFRNSVDFKTDFKGDLGGVSAYLLKYILKTFKNSKNGELSDVAYWYIKNQIRRFTTSRTIIPIGVYRKIKSMPEFRDLLHMTHLYNDGFISFDLIADNERYLNCLKNNEKMKSVDYKVDKILISVAGFDFMETKIAYKRSNVVSVFLERKGFSVFVRDLQALNRHKIDLTSVSNCCNLTLSSLFDELNPHYEPFIKCNPLEFGTQQRALRKNEKKLPVTAMKDLTLCNYYLYLNTFECNIQHLALVENELLKRGFKDIVKGLEKPHDLNDPSLENFIERDKRYYEF